MKSGALGTILGALALGCVGLVYLKVDDLSKDVAVIAGRQPAGTPVVAGSDRIESHGRVRRVDDAPRSERPGAEVEPGDGGAEVTARPASLEERIAKLERAREQDKSRVHPRGWAAPMMRQRVHTVDQLAKRLKLTPTQRTRVAEAIERGKQRIEDLMKIPDADGKSPHERRQARRKKIAEAVKNREHGGLLSIATDMFGYRNREIPGRGATYGQEMDRIRNETREDVGSALSPEQAETFKDTNIDAMVGAESGAMQLSFMTTGDGEDGEAAGMIVEADTTIIGGAPVEVERAAGGVAPPPPEEDK